MREWVPFLITPYVAMRFSFLTTECDLAPAEVNKNKASSPLSPFGFCFFFSHCALHLILTARDFVSTFHA